MSNLTGTVYRSTGSWYDVKDIHGKDWRARARGVFKVEGITSTNPIAVGDEVVLEPEPGQEEVAQIIDILPRQNYISRQSPSHRKQHHIVASNLHQSLLVATIKNPRTSTGFIDRFLIAAEAYHVPAVLAVNKADTWSKKEEEIFAAWQGIYEPLGYAMLATSAATGQGLPQLKAMLAGKTTLISGHSGVGKSSLLNALMPGFSLRTKEVSQWSGKGMHTTTFAQMFDLPEGGHVIDTPGMREFGIVHMERAELSHYFPEMRNLIHQCQFNNCQHLEEPGCAIKAALEAGQINANRYLSYLSIFDSLPQNHWE
ncbi:MAG TPA: ribosome small subunit-dependent GTPase A [Phnomibacter sp.]|nr:ribosome small subunit-dependent GTPase A [Phnomibacter sp.]